jgi:hypothetical protein
MGKTAVHQPHDKLFKATFSKTRNARAFFENHLPAHVVPTLDWKTLRRLSATFIHPGLKGSESDLLFSVRARGSRGVYFLLLEHQSTEDPCMALRLAGYIQWILEHFVRENRAGSPLPRVLPVVLAQCKEPWRTAQSLDAVFGTEGPPELLAFFRQHQLALEYHLVDVNRLEYAGLRGTPDGVIALRALKAAQAGDLLGDWVWEEKLLLAISPDAFRQWIRYLEHSVVDRAGFLRRIETFSSQAMKNKTRTLAEQLIEHGRKEGIEKGRVEGRRESAVQAVLQALRIRHGRVPEGLADAVEEVQDLQKLELLHSGAIRSASLEEFAQSL